jgi:hypothetical protein
MLGAFCLPAMAFLNSFGGRGEFEKLAVFGSLLISA